MGTDLEVLQVMLCCPHKQAAHTNLDTMSDQEAKVDQQEQCNWTFGPAAAKERELLTTRDTNQVYLLVLPKFSLRVARGDPVG